PEYFGVDVDGTTGDVYVIDKAHASAYVLNSSGTAILAQTHFTAQSAPNLFDLAVDQSNGDFFVTSSIPNEEGTTSVVDEFKSSGKYVAKLPQTFGGTLRLEGIRGPSDIAVDNSAASPNDGDVFVASADGRNARDSVYAFGPSAGAPTMHKLSVIQSGNGHGTVSCEVNRAFEECASEYAEGSEVALQGAAQAGSVFMGWSGGSGAATSCAGATACAVELAADSAVSARFLLEDTLAVEETGAGSGVVTSEPAGIDCGGTCEAVFSPGQAVTLTAAPIEGKVGGWTGCESVTGPGAEKCTVSISGARLVSVELIAEPVLSVVKEGTGAAEALVTSTPAGIDCGSECSHPTPLGETVVLEQHAEGTTFDGWTGCTSEEEGKCSVLVSQAREVRAKFTAPAPASFTLEAHVGGHGELVAEGGTIACDEGGGACSEEVVSSSTVKLAANAEAGWAFEEWTEGPCAGQKSASCQFVMPSHAVSVTAKFAVSHNQKVTIVKFGEGVVTVTSPAGLSCPAAQLSCMAEYAEGTQLVLQESPSPGYQFAGWIGCK